MVGESSWCGDDDLGVFFQLGDLFCNGLTTIETEGANACFVGVEDTEFVFDLDS